MEETSAGKGPPVAPASCAAIFAISAVRAGILISAALPVTDKVLSTDRIPINLVGLVKDGFGDPGIKNGDVLYVPQKPEMVIVSGAVLMPSPIVWQPKKSARAYIERTGGFAKDAAEDEVVVMRVNGELVKERKAGDIEPGDLILVPPKALIAYPGAFEQFLNVLQVVSGGFFTWNVVR